MMMMMVIIHQLSPQRTRSWWGSANSWKMDRFLGQVQIPPLNFFVMFVPSVPNYDTRRRRMPSKSHSPTPMVVEEGFVSGKCSGTCKQALSSVKMLSNHQL